MAVDERRQTVCGVVRYILRRRGKYLNARYQWSLTPHSFAEWEFPTVLEEAMQYRDHPQYVGEITGGELDKVVWKKLD